jgi:hypothetical protein
VKVDAMTMISSHVWSSDKASEPTAFAVIFPDSRVDSVTGIAA